MQVARRGETFREGKNPFTGEVVRFYDHQATKEEIAALEEVLERYGIEFDYDSMSNYGEIEETMICIPHMNLSDGYFGGASIELVGNSISDKVIEAVLEMGRSANLFFSSSIGEGALAAPTAEVESNVQAFRDEQVLLVDTVAKMRSWLLEHVGARKVI